MSVEAVQDRGPDPRVLVAADILSAPVVTVSVRDSLWVAWTVLYRSGFRHVVVLDDARCVGVLDDRRIILEWPVGALRANPLLVGDVIRREFTVVHSDTRVSQIAQIMLYEHVDAVPVVSGRNEIVGLVTVSDLLTVFTTMAAHDVQRPDTGGTNVP
jgi:CBS domain-containing protein